MNMNTPGSEPLPTSARLSVAVADDVPEIQHLVGLWLKELGHGVICVGNGRDLTALVNARRFDVVVTDVVMPDSDGFEVIGEVKKTQPDARILAISGGGTVMLANDCLRVAKRLGAHEVLTKPFNQWQFVEAFRRVTAGLASVAG
jgi:DNA-binding NtrC family response regulator